MAPKPLPSPELLRKLLRYEPVTGKLYWRERSVEHFRDSAARKASHINGVRDDNRWKNLRAVDRGEQMKNTAFRSDNTSGAMGVSKEKKCKSWRVRIGSKNIGFYPTFDQAVEARRRAEIELDYHPNHGRPA